MTRPADQAVAAGSVAILDAGWTDDELVAIAAGIGLRRAEGCGEVAFVTNPAPTLRDLSLIPGDQQGSTRATRTPDDERAPDVCRLFADSLGDARREAVLNSVIDAVREIRAVLERGTPVGVAMMQASAVLQFPWATDLGPDSREHLTRLLRNDKEAAAYDRDQHLAHLYELRNRGPRS